MRTPTAHRFAFRRKKYPSAPIDKEFECYHWANVGECHKNKARASNARRRPVRRAALSSCAPTPQEYMEKSCPETCKDRYDPPADPPPPPPRKKSKKKKRKAKKGGGDGAAASD